MVLHDLGDHVVVLIVTSTPSLCLTPPHGGPDDLLDDLDLDLGYCVRL